MSSLVSLDREQQKEYLLPILISDSGKPPMVGTSTLTVTVGDVNDNSMISGSCHITVYKLEVRTCLSIFDHLITQFYQPFFGLSLKKIIDGVCKVIYQKSRRSF